jgi:hypothetical protein
MKKLALLALIIFCLTTSAQAACDAAKCIQNSTNAWTAATCDKANVQECFTNCAVSGDTVNIPAGSCQWDQPNSWTPSVSVPSSKNLNIVGSGVGSVTITGGDSCQKVLNLGGSASKVSNITFNKSAILASGSGWRIHDNVFYNPVETECYAIQPITSNASMMSAGLIDHNIFTNTAIVSSAVTIDGVDYSSFSWATPTGFGDTSSATYIENNTFTGGYIDAARGGRFVMRYNKMTNTPLAPHGVQEAVSYRSNARMEFYRNAIDSGVGFGEAGPRGGQLLIYDNLGTGTHTNFMYIDNQTSTRYGDYPGAATCPSPYKGAACDGRNPRDGNRAGMEGYPCRDQFGRGADASTYYYMTISNIVKTNSTTLTITYTTPRSPNGTAANGTTAIITGVVGMTELNGNTYAIGNLNTTAKTFTITVADTGAFTDYVSGGLITSTYSQALSPLYSCNNVMGGADRSNPQVWAEPNPITGCSDCSNTNRYLLHLVANRDFYYSSGVQTSPSSPFDGQTGMGFGLLANRPTNCNSLPVPTGIEGEAGGGVAYWATDEKKLYRCSSTNTWSVHYAESSFPHSLDTEHALYSLKSNCFGMDTDGSGCLYMGGAITHTVTFSLGLHGTRAGGGDLSQTVNHGSSATSPTVTANTGYTFLGWDASFSAVTADLTITALYGTDRVNSPFWTRN